MKYLVVRVRIEQGPSGFQAKDLSDAVTKVGHMLNGCHPPGEIVYRVEGHKSDQTTKSEPDIIFDR